jgi:hypothetical protein
LAPQPSGLLSFHCVRRVYDRLRQADVLQRDNFFGQKPQDQQPIYRSLKQMLAEPCIRGIDPKLTENFLLAQHGVLDASVWFEEGRMMAHVTIIEDTSSPKALQRACMEELGLHQTPRQILLLQSRNRAA